MGSEMSVSIGPYLEVTGTKRVDTPKVRRECPKHPRINQSESKFCKECGELIQNVDYIDTVTLNPKQLLWHAEGIEDELFSPDYIGKDSIFLPNHTVPGKLKIRDENGGIVELTNATEEINTQIDWFKTRYAKVIKFLTETFGYTNVQIKWGVVVYWS